jgi:hypothetical protein
MATKAQNRRKPQIGIFNETDKEVIKYVLGGGAVILVAWIGYSKISGAIKDKQDENFALQSTNYGSAESYASQLQAAFDYKGWGNTDKGLVFKTLNAIPNRATWLAVQQVYKSRFGKNLYDEIKEEFGDWGFGGDLADVDEIISKYR